MIERYFSVICLLIASLGIALSMLVSNAGTSIGRDGNLPLERGWSFPNHK